MTINSIDINAMAAVTEGALNKIGEIDSGFENELLPKVAGLPEKSLIPEVSGELQKMVGRIKDAIANHVGLQGETFAGETLACDRTALKKQLKNLTESSENNELPIIYQLQELIARHANEYGHALTDVEAHNLPQLGSFAKLSAQYGTSVEPSKGDSHTLFESPGNELLPVEAKKGDDIFIPKSVSVSERGISLAPEDVVQGLTGAGDIVAHDLDTITSQLVSAVSHQKGSAPSAIPVSNSALTQQVGTTEWEAEFGQQLTIFTRNGVQNAELKLNPAELGSIKINVQIKNDIADIHFVTENQHVRAALDIAMPQLRTSLDQSGITLGNTSMEHGSGHTEHNSKGHTDAHDTDWHDKEKGAGESQEEGATESVRREITLLGTINTYV